MERSGESCSKLFKELKIVPCTSQYILSLLLFVTNNKIYFIRYSEKYSIHTRHSDDLHLPQTNWLFIKKEFIIQVLKYLVIFHQILKILLTILRDLK
jgi:hypothetical protein